MNDLWFGEECFIETLSAFMFVGHKRTNHLRNAVVVLHRKAKPMAWIPLTLLKWVVPRKRRRWWAAFGTLWPCTPPQRCCPFLAMLTVPQHSLPLPSIVAHDVFLTLRKMPLTEPSHSRWESQEESRLGEGGGKERKTRLLGPPHFCPSTYCTSQISRVASFGGQPQPQNTLRNHRRISSLLLARPFSHRTARHLVTAVEEDGRNQTPGFSLSLPKTPGQPQRELLVPAPLV